MTNKELFDGMNRTLDQMIETLNREMAVRDAAVQEMLKDEPETLLRYKNAIFKANEWVKAHPFQCPPDASFFLK